ncbi:MAG: DUF4147 domain-containing protein [Ginsengibacter sp.]
MRKEGYKKKVKTGIRIIKRMSLRLHAREIFNAAIEAVLPSAVLPVYIERENDLLILDGKKYQLKNKTKIFVIAIGKAAAPMMAVVHNILGKAIHQSLVITKEAHEISIENCIVMEADHPVPGEKSVSAAGVLLKFVRNTHSNDIILFLISGGASSLVTDVPGTLTLNDIKHTQNLLLLSGADINKINTVRKHLSNLKGGQLIRYCNDATIFSFIISDVVGNNVSIIGSGLTAPDNSSVEDAMNIIWEFNLLQKIPPAVINYLKSKTESKTLKASDGLFKNVKNIIVADSKMALQKARIKAASLGYHMAYMNDAMFGNTEAESINLVKKIKNYTGKKPACFIAGGETTIEVKGNGKGGRNQHFALTMLHELCKQYDEENSFPVILAAGTDGTDGPTDAAGAIIDASLIRQIKKENLPVEEYLRNNDSYNFFRRTNSLLITGPAQTNVMDIVIALIQ